MTLLASIKDLEIKVVQLEQGVQSEEQLGFDRRLASKKAEIKLYNHQNYVTIIKEIIQSTLRTLI